MNACHLGHLDMLIIDTFSSNKYETKCRWFFFIPWSFPILHLNCKLAIFYLAVKWLIFTYKFSPFLFQVQNEERIMISACVQVRNKGERWCERDDERCCTDLTPGVSFNLSTKRVAHIHIAQHTKRHRKGKGQEGASQKQPVAFSRILETLGITPKSVDARVWVKS